MLKAGAAEQEKRIFTARTDAQKEAMVAALDEFIKNKGYIPNRRSDDLAAKALGGFYRRVKSGHIRLNNELQTRFDKAVKDIQTWKEYKILNNQNKVKNVEKLEAFIKNKEDGDALLSAYDAALQEADVLQTDRSAARDAENWPQGRAFLALQEELKIKYNKAYFETYRRLFELHENDILRMLERVRNEANQDTVDRLLAWIVVFQLGCLGGDAAYQEFYTAEKAACLEYGDVVDLPATRERFLARFYVEFRKVLREAARELTQREEYLLIELLQR
ncbi:MAG: hypothetical protein LBJ25_03985 [Candidatus Margulisbacteria bacterium]|jgi:hypothetical protein|nr:hypothetical protein [Candidatus Margulisiibacteriota bacterium]